MIVQIRLFFSCNLLLDLMKSKDVLEAASASKHLCHLQSKYSNFRSTLSHLHSSLACCKDILLQNIVKGIIYLILIYKISAQENIFSASNYSYHLSDFQLCFEPVQAQISFLLCPILEDFLSRRRNKCDLGWSTTMPQR